SYSGISIDGNIFGFEGPSSRLYKEGPFFGGRTIVGPVPNPISEGQSFELEIKRDFQTLTFMIDGQQVWSFTPFRQSIAGEIELFPGKTSLTVENFEVIGDFRPFDEHLHTVTDQFVEKLAVGESKGLI